MDSHFPVDCYSRRDIRFLWHRRRCGIHCQDSVFYLYRAFSALLYIWKKKQRSVKDFTFFTINTRERQRDERPDRSPLFFFYPPTSTLMPAAVTHLRLTHRPPSHSHPAPSARLKSYYDRLIVRKSKPRKSTSFPAASQTPYANISSYSRWHNPVHCLPRHHIRL